MSKSTRTSTAIQPTGPATSLLANDFEFTITSGVCCPKCSDGIRAIDAEALGDHAIRLVCMCGHLFLHCGPRT